jgi:hypothetical protein
LILLMHGTNMKILYTIFKIRFPNL